MKRKIFFPLLLVVLFQKQYLNLDVCTDVAYQMALKMGNQIYDCIWTGEYYNELSCKLVSDSSLPTTISFHCDEKGKLIIWR